MATVVKTDPSQRPFGRTILGLVLLVGLAPLPVPAQPPPQVQGPGEVIELKDGEITPDRLIEILAPATATRGLGVGKPAANPQPPQCRLVRRRLTRGIKVEPVAPMPALPIRFAFNSARLEPQAIPVLDAIGAAIASQRLAPFCFSIEGHTDGIGSHRFNDRLSQRRAETVVSYLVRQFGVEPQRLVPVGRGKRAPLVGNDSEEGRQRNRRVEIVNLGGGEDDL
jgi:hypothetical protein